MFCKVYSYFISCIASTWRVLAIELMIGMVARIFVKIKDTIVSSASLVLEAFVVVCIGLCFLFWSHY